MARKIQHKRGLEANLPQLDVAEIAFTTDSKKPFIGSADGNVEIAKKADVDAKASKTELTNAVSPKADKTYVDTELSKKASTDEVSAVSAQLADKATKTEVTNAVTPKADKAYVDGELAKKPDKSYVDTKTQGVSLAYKESYATLADLQSAYPTGDTFNHAVLADGMIYTYVNGAWTNTQIQANGTGIADGTVSEIKLDETLKTKVNTVREIPEITSEVQGLQSVATELGYERRKNTVVVSSGTYQSDKAIASTFAGFAAPLRYTGETFHEADIYVVTDGSDVPVEGVIMDANLNVLAVSEPGIAHGTGWTNVKFTSPVGSNVITGDLFYFGMRSVNRAHIISTANTSPSTQFAGDAVTAPTYYVTTTNGTWRASSGGIGTIALVNLKDNSVVPEYIKTGVDETAIVKADVNGFKQLLSSMGYEENRDYETVITSGTYQADGEIVSTFAGFAVPLFYDDETFDRARVYLVTEEAGLEIKCTVRDQNLNEITSVVSTFPLTAGWHTFDFPIVLDNTKMTGDYFYISAETVDRTKRMTTAITEPSYQFAGGDIIKVHYNTTSSTAWKVSSGNTTKLLVELKNKSNAVTTFSRPRSGIALPPSIDAVVGKEINVYFDNILSGYHEDYYIDVSCAIGVQQNERWTAIPSTSGNYTLTVVLYDKDYQQVDSASTVIRVKGEIAGDGVTRSALFIGSSTTASGTYTAELLNLFDEDVMDLQLIGTVGTAPNLHEGRGGWTFERYNTNTESPFVFNGAFSLSDYLTANGFAVPDYVCLQLGINDIFSSKTDKELYERNSNAMNHMENMISTIQAQYPSVKIGVVVTYPSADQDAFGKTYGTGQTAWRYKRNAFLASREMFNQLKGRESENVYIVPVLANIDARNNMPEEEVQVNARNPELITRQANGIHLAASGYYQMADSIYYWLKGFEV